MSAVHIKDPQDVQLAGLFAAPYQDDRHGTIAKYRKRRYREGYYMTTCLRTCPDNNAVRLKDDGGGNRSWTNSRLGP